MEKDQVLAAAQMAVASDVNNMTCDRIEALAAGHGMVNMAIHSVANVIAEEILSGGDLSVKFANARHLPMEIILGKAIEAAKVAGADGANAALISAAMMYLCGSSAQVGIPAGNRKLGATARMMAGVDRCGVAMIPTAKMNNKISGWPAVEAVYRAMQEGTLCSIKGKQVPMFVSGGPVYGHSALGEDIIWPEMAINGARIGTQAMIDAMDGAAMHPHPFTCAVLGAAAILEIIHPDAEVPEEMGDYGRTSSAYLVGKSAVETAGLPETLHVKVFDEEFETAKVVGDMGLMLKDIGGVSVIGMMAFDEIFSIFKEGIAGFSGMPLNPPLGHVGAYCVIALKGLLRENGDTASVAKQIAEECYQTKLDGESGLISINTMATKSLELHWGPVTHTLIDATEPAKANAIYRRTVKAYEMLSEGSTVDEVAHAFDDERLAAVEAGANRIFSSMLGTDFSIKMTKLGKAARRTNPLACKYWSFDSDIDAVVNFGGTEYKLVNFCADLVPKIAKGEMPELEPIAPFVAAVCSELMLAGHTILNCIVPAAVAAAMHKGTVEEVATLAEKGAYITIGIPGGKTAAKRVATLAENTINYMER